MRKTKIENRKSKIGTGLALGVLFPFFAFRFSLIVLSALWRWLREVSGDDAYEKYVARRDAAESLLSPGEFYCQRLERKYSRPSRCC